MTLLCFKANKSFFKALVKILIQQTETRKKFLKFKPTAKNCLIFLLEHISVITNHRSPFIQYE